METKHIRSEFDRKALDVLKAVVPGQENKLIDTGTGLKRVWTSYAKEKDGIVITTVIRNGETVAKFVYDYESNEEKAFLY